MATKEEVIKKLAEYIGEDKSDGAIELMEIVNDSMDDSKITSLESEIATLKQEKADLDNSWREKYMKRFTDATPTTTGDEKDEVDTGANDSEEEDLEPPTFEEIAEEF